MKWNWGTKIVISFILFCGFILFMVFQAFRQNIDLVSESYYQDELNYQQRIENKSNLAKSGVSISLVQEGKNIVVQYPNQFGSAEGKIYFYHPSRKVFDQTFQMIINEEGKQLISTKDLVPGRFKVKMSWEAGGKTYFQEKELYIR